MSYSLNLIKTPEKRPKKKVSRIAIKFSGIVSVLILIVMFLMATLILRQTRESKIKEMEIRAQFFARDARESIFPRPDLFQLFFSVQEMVKEEAILYAVILDKDGKIIAHSVKEKIGERDDSKIGLRALESSENLVQLLRQGKELFYDVSIPVIIGGKQRVGTARIGFSQASISKALARMRNKIISITILVLAGSIILTTLVVTFMVNPINHLAKAAREIGKGNLNQHVSIKTKDEFGELANNFNEMVKGLKERDLIRDTFGKYVTTQVADTVLDGKLKLGGERLEATILMSDIRDFTKLADKSPPEEVVEFLNKYFTRMVDIVFKYDGTLDKFIGDALLAVFGAPFPHEDDAVRAIWTSLEMQLELKKFNDQRKKEGKEPIRMGIAIHTGDVVAGNIGSEKRMEYTVIGDTVNLVSRLEELNKEFGTEILISKSTYDKVKLGISVKELPPVQVRGKEEPVQVYQLIGLGG